MATQAAVDQPETMIQCSASESFAAWMSSAGGTIAVTTYQAGKVAMVGWDGRQVTLLMRQFAKPMGLAVRGPSLALATRHQIILLSNASLLAGDYLPDQPGRYDALYLPRSAYYTGDVAAHDLGYGDDGLWVVNTRFSCLCGLSKDFSFVPRWKPPFVSEIAPEDRCHLNGLAIVEGKPRYVTALGQTDAPGVWREKKATGGLIMDIQSNQIITSGLAMPHSPRWYKGQLWVLNSGAGELWVVNPKDGRHVVVCTLSGYLRGLSFVGPYALIGLCQIREKHIFGGLPVQERFQKLLCGVAVIDLRTGGQVGMLEFTSGCQELYEVLFLPGIRQPMVVNADMEQGKEAFTAPQFAYWLRPSNEVG